jgi:uncharacterized protein (TIGR00369 family)
VRTFPVFEAPDPDFTVKVRDSFESQKFMKMLGATLERIEPGHVEIHLARRAELTQQHGYLHAGVLASIADSACGYAAFTLMPPGSNVLSVEFKVNLLRPAASDLVIAEARVIRAGRNITVCQAEVLSASGAEMKPVCLFTGTMMRVDAEDPRPTD